MAPTSAPTTAALRNVVIELLGDITDLSDIFANRDSASYRAVQWLAEHQVSPEDPLNLPERYAMVTFYYSTGGDNGSWNDDMNWLSATEPMCQWYGINCTVLVDGDKISSIAALDLGTSFEIFQSTHHSRGGHNVCIPTLTFVTVFASHSFFGLCMQLLQPAIH